MKKLIQCIAILALCVTAVLNAQQGKTVQTESFIKDDTNAIITLLMLTGLT